MSLARRLRAALDAGPALDSILLLGDGEGLVPDAEGQAAAVLVAITDREHPGVILTQRPETMRRHPGQIAFPGGRIDPEDAGPVAAALREAEEEIALVPALVEIVGTFELYRTVTGFDVTPVIGVVPPDLVFVANEAEVADVFEIPLAFLLDPENHRESAMMYEGHERRFYEIIFDERRIWGATAAMLINLSRRLQWVA